MRSGDRKNFKIALPIKGETAHFGDVDFIYVENVGWVADRNIVTSISYDNLDELGFAKGHKITLDGAHYICHIPTFAEWDLMMDYSDSDAVWHWNAGFSWVYLKESLRTNSCVTRGGERARDWHGYPSHGLYPHIGWRPVLVPYASNMPDFDERTCENCRYWQAETAAPICRLCHCCKRGNSLGDEDMWALWRWRGGYGATYYYISYTYNQIGAATEWQDLESDKYFQNGNYYQSLADAAKAYLAQQEKYKSDDRMGDDNQLPSDGADSNKTCNSCKYEDVEPNGFPCVVCTHRYIERWEPAEPPRWRGKRGEMYWYFTDKYIGSVIEADTDKDYESYEHGRYFPSLEAAARAYLAKLGEYKGVEKWK